MPTCLYCDKDLYHYTNLSHFLSDDPLCLECREKMMKKELNINLDSLKVKALYPYESLFRSILLQYKEACDEALYPVFLRPYLDYLRLLYHGYTIVTIPSSRSKLSYRGFDHMELMVSEVQLPKLKALCSIKDINQSQKDLKERRKMQNNFALLTRKLPAKILLIDDVITSGSSLLGAYNVLRPHVKKIKALTLAYSDVWQRDLPSN